MTTRRLAFGALFPYALALAAVPLGHAAPAAPDVGALAHCAAMTNADERLACYDSLARPKPSPATAGSSSSVSAKPAVPPPASSAPAPVSGGGTAAAAAPATGASSKATPAPPAGTAAAASTDAKSFGLTKHTAPPDQGLDHLQAKVTRVDTSRLGKVRVSLDNGQSWSFDATDTLLRTGDAVTIKRGVLGSFLLTTPEHHTYKAERLQ